MLAFAPLPASGNLGGAAINLSSDTANPNHELTIILDDQSNPTFVTATITTFDGTTTKTGQFFNFSKISYAASNDTDGSVVNSVKLWTSYEADLAGYENAPSDKSQVGLSTSWRVDSRFPAGAATTSPLFMENVDELVVTSGVIGGGASTIAGEFESPTLAPLTPATAAKVTLNSGTRVTGANIGGTAALEPIVVYSLAITTQTGDVNLATDVFTVDDLSITAAKDVTLSGLLQVEEGDITIASTSGSLALGAGTFFAHALDGMVSLSSECGTVSVQKVCAAEDVTVIGELGVTVGGVIDAGDNITITAENGPVTVADLLAGEAIDIDAGKAIAVNGLVRASTGNIAITSVSDAVSVSAAAKVHAVVGSIDIDATRGPATLQNLFAEESIAVDALGDVSLSGTIQTTKGDFVVNSDGNIDNSARLLIGGSLKLDSGLNVRSLGGGIVRVELLSGGTDYEYAIVTIAAPAAGGGRAALARATITGGAVTGLTIVDPGFGYAPNEQVAVSIEGNPETKAGPAASGARATAFAGSTLSSMQAGKNLEILSGTAVDITNELRAESGKVTVAVSAGPLSLSDIFAGEDVSLTAAQTIDLGGLVRTATGDVAVESTGGGLDVGATLLAPAGGAKLTAAGQIVQRGGSVSRDRLFLLSGGRDYTYALVVVDPPPGAGQAALARAVITYYNPLDPTEGGFISDIILLDPGWGYPSDSRVNVSIQGDGEGASAVFATDIVTSSIDVRDDVTVQAGDAITLVSSVRSSAGNVTIRNSIGDLAVQSLTSNLAAEVESARGKVTLVSVVAGDKVNIAAFRGVMITDSVNTSAGDIAVTTTDGDLQFVQGFDFGDNYLVNADATALQPLAVIATADGGIALRSDNGSITTPFVINATDDVTITSFGLLEATNEITSTQGNVELRSTSGLVQLEANVAAVEGSITIAAHTQLKQQVSSGVSKIQLLSPGEVVENTAPQVTVTVAAPRNGGTAATAVAIIERRSTGDGEDDEYFLGAIAIIDAGQGYAVGEQPSVTITGINGASARAFGPLNAAMLTAGEGITLTAGEDLTLVTKIHATTGNVVVGSAAGDIDLADRSLLLSAAAGAISVDAPRGTVVVQRAAAAEDVTINGLGGIEILGSVVSEDAGITLKALDGAVDVRQVNAAGDVTITSFKSGTLAGEIASSAGAVSFTSLAGGLFLEANIVAAGAVDIDAQTFILQDGRSGVERIDVINGGSATGGAPPTVTVTVAEPAAGGVAARAQAVIGQRSATEYFIESIFINDPGTGYARGELAEVTITGMSGAVARAFGPTSLRNVTAGAGITLDAGDDITLVNAVTASTGDILVASVSGNVGMGVSSAILNAVVGSVTVKADTGAAQVNAVYAGTDITIDVAEQVALFGVLESDAGNVEVKSWKRDVDLTPSGARIAVDAGSATLTALNGSVLTPRVLHAAGDITIRGLTTIELRNEITSNGGSITVESVSGGIDISGNINAAQNAIDLVASGTVTQSSRGVAYVEVLAGGAGYNDSATVTIAPPAAVGGRAATARLLLGTVSGISGVIIGISVVDPGAGYAVGEVPVVTINAGVSTGTGGAAGAVVAVGEQNLVGGTGVEITTGDDITLLNTVTATTGDVVVTSLSGNLQLGGDGFLARALGGSVSLTGSAGSLVVQRASAVEDVTLFGAKGVTVEGSVDAGNDATVVTGADGRVSVTRIVAGDSVTVTAGDDVELLELVDAATGGVLVTSTAGDLVTNDIYAELDITLKTADQVYLLGVLESAAGDIAIESVAGSVELYSANLLASSGAITVTAHGVVNQPTSTGVVDVRGQSTGQIAAATAPEVIVTIAAPASGTGTAATARATVVRIDTLADGGGIFIDPFGNVVVLPPSETPVWGVIGVTVTNPGSGYAPNERPAVTFTGIPNAVYEAFAAGSFPTNIVAAEDVRITGGGNVLLSSVVQSNSGDIAIASVSGNLDLSADTFFAHALEGSVVLDSDCGTVVVERVCAEDAVLISAEKGVTIENDIDAGGDITVTAASGLVDSALSGKQITSRDGAITISGRTVFLGPLQAENAIDLDAQGSIVVSAVTSQAGGFSVVSRSDSISLSGAIVAESVNGSAQREFAVLAPLTARTGDVTIVANDGTVALQADVTAVKGDIDLTGRAILQGGLGVAKVEIDAVVDGDGNILGQKAGEGYSAATTKVVISAPRRGGTAAQAVPIVGKVQVGTKTQSTTDADGNTVTIEVPVEVDSGIVQLILTSPGSGYEIGEPVTVNFIDPNVEAVASATVTLQSVVPNASLIADSGEVRLRATTESLSVQTVKAGSSVALNAHKSVTVTDSVVSGGAISLTTPAGGVTARDLLAAEGITIAGFEDARLSRQVHTKTGDIDVRSTAGSVSMAANVLASEGDVVLNAHHGISQAQNGLERIVLTFGGDDYTSPIVTVSPPRGGGTAATARAITSNEAPGPVLAIELLTPGSGYAPGEFVTVTIDQDGNQSAAAIGIASTSDPKIVAGGKVEIAAGGDVELENEVRAVTGAVSISSVGGDVELSAPNVIVHAEADAVSVSAATGLVNLGRVIAEEGIDVFSLHALTAAGTLVSEVGDISLGSKAAGVSLSSVVTADAGSIDISAFAAIESKRNGVSRIEILAAGTGYDPDTTSVIFAPPGGTLQGNVATGARFGSRAAAGRVNVDQQGRVVGIQVLDPGIGYLPGEAVQVDVLGSGSGASVTAYVDRPVVALSAGSNVTLTAGDDVEVIATVRSTKAGNVSVSSLSGDVTLDADGSLLQAVQGDVAITATAGRVTMPQVTAGGAFAASARTGLVLNRAVDAGTGDISMRTLHGELRLAQSASVVAKTGDISLASEAGTVQTFAVLNAGDAISVASLGTLTLAGSVVSKAGAIELKSVASDVAFSGIVSAETNTATISAFGNVESATGGVTRIEMVNRGTGYVDVFTQVVVLRGGETVDDDGVIEPDPAELNPRDGFRRAAARAVLNEDGQVVAIEIVDPGRRYLQTDDVRIVIRDTRSDNATGQGATAVAYVDPSDQTLSGLLDVDVTAGRDITLVGVVRSLQGDVTVTSTSGNIGSQDQALPLLHAIQGAVSVTANAGEAWVAQITAGEDVDVAAKRGVVVSEAIDSTAGDIAIATTHGDLSLENASLVAKAGSVSLTSVAGQISSPLVLKAADAISIASLGRLTLSGAIASTAGSINLESTAANVTFNAVVTAEQGQVSIAAFGEIESFEGGVSRTTLISGGQNYQKGFTQVIVIKNGETVDPVTGQVQPDANETNAREGFRAATVVAIVAEDGTITGLRISDPGTGYLQSDNVRIVIRDQRGDEGTGVGASGLAFVDPAVQTVAALGNASLRAGGDIQVIGVVRSLEGDVIVESTSGDLALGGDNVVLQAIEGSVSLTANAGSAKVQQISSRNDVIVEAKTGVTLAGKIDSSLGDISLTTTHGHLELDLPGASVVAPGGGVALLSKAGRIEGPDAISASGPIAITSFDTLVANGRISSSAGAVELRSTAGDIDLNAVVEAKNDAILIQAFANINSRDGGVSRIQIVTEGRGYADSNTLVYVLFEDEVNLVDEDTFALTSGDTANSRGEAFRRAAARAILDEQGAVVAVELVDRGSGYLPTDRLITRVFDTRPDDERAGGGATLVTYVDPSAQALSAGSDVTLKAGDDLTLIGIVRSTAGDVRVESVTGNIDLAANQAVLQTLLGDVSVSALAGTASIRQINAQSDVDVFASRGVEILRAVESKAGDIGLRTDLGDIDLDTVITEVTESKTSTGVRLWAAVGAIEMTATTGKINTPQTLRAGGDITITSLGTVELADSIVSDAGDITVDSAAARVTLNAVVKAAEGSVTIRSSSDLDDIGGGLTRIDIVNGGTSYSNATTVRVSAPRNGGDAARVRPIIENGRITRLEIVYAGKGYEPGETVVLIGDDTFVDFPESDGDVRGRGAEAIAFCESPTQSIEAKESITVETRDNLKMFGVLRAEGVGGITLRSRAGDVDLVGANRTSTVADATNGGVAVFAPAGAARVFDLLADTTVVVEAEQDITANGLIRATEGLISVVSTSGDVVVQGQGKLHAVTGSVEVLATRGDAKVQNLFAGQDITLATLGDVKLTEAVHAATGDLTVVTKAGIDNAGTVETGGSISLTATLGVTSLGGGIVRIDLLSGGANYEYAIVTISGPASGGGRAATARATIDDAGTITAIAIVDPGYGYASGEVVNVQIEGQLVRPVPGGAPLPAGDGARAVATASPISSSLTAGDSITIAAGTVVDLTNELRAKLGGVSVDVAAGPLKLSEVFAAQDVSLTAAQTISLGGLLRTSGGNVDIESTGGGLDMRGTILAPAGGVEIDTAGQIVQRGGSVSRDKIFLLSGGRDYTYALVVVSPPPGAGETALARAVITDPDPFDDEEGGYISEIVLLDGGWGYPSDSRVNVTIQGDGEGAVAIFGTDVVSSSIDARDNVTIRSGDTVTLVSTVRSALGDVEILTTLGDVSIESITAGGAIDVTSNRGEVTLVTVSGQQDVAVNADQGLSVSDSLNTVAGNISLETTNGDITFVKQLNFGDNYLVDDAATAIEPEAVISTKLGGITMTAHNGAIVSPYVINAALDVSLTSLLAMELTNQITSQSGDIDVESTSGLVRVRSNMVAEEGSITIEAQTSLQQEFVSGISKIELLSPGPIQTVPPAVTVTIAPPRNGGEAATAFAVIERRALDNQGDDGDDGNPFDNVVDYEYFIGSIAIITAGRGYEVGENPVVTITGVDGATAKAYGPNMVAMLTAQRDINLLAGENITLVTKIHAVEGNVTIASKAGDMDLSANTLFVSSKAGGIGIDAYGGSVELQRLSGFKNVTVNAEEGIDVLRSVVSRGGSIEIVSTNNAVNVRQLNAKQDVTVSGFKTSTLVGEIVATKGDVNATSTAGGLRLNANILAGDDITLEAQTFLEQLNRTGIEALQIISEGSDRQVTLEPVPPDVTVTIAAPAAAGGRAATARAILGRRFLGNDPGGTDPIYEYFIDKVEIIDAGAGYAIGESPIVTITGMPGAVVRGIGPTNLRNITARNNLSIHAEDDMTLLYRLTANKGDLSISSLSGDIDLGSKLLRMTVPGAKGDVSITTESGSIILPPVINIAGDITLRSFAPLTIGQQLTTSGGDVRLTSTAGSLAVNANVFAADRIELSSKLGITQNGGFMKAAELKATNMNAAGITLGSQGNDVDRFAATNVGDVSYTDADDFRVGLQTSGTMGVEVTGNFVSLSSVAPDSIIRVVAGMNYRRLNIAAGTLGGDDVGMVEFVVTSPLDSTSTAFSGRLRDMITYVSDNRASYVDDGATLPQPMTVVFDEPGYVISEIQVASSLPAFRRPVLFDGGRVADSVASGRLGIRGSATAPTGITLAAGSGGSTIRETALYGFSKGSAAVLESPRNTVIDTYFGIQADGVTTSANLVGVNLSGSLSRLNTIGSKTYDAQTANKFAASTDAGILIQQGAFGNLVVGNEIGIAGLAKNRDGVRIDGSNGNRIGSEEQLTPDLSPIFSNRITNNARHGVSIVNTQGTGVADTNRVQNNFVGDNAGHGVSVQTGTNVVIGGDTRFHANVFAKNAGSGVYLGAATRVNVVGNHIGVDSEATKAMGNGRMGVEVAVGSGSVRIEKNRISANTTNGVGITSRTSGVVITDNVIGGLLEDGTAAGNKFDGVLILNANGNIVGKGNLISQNLRSGVNVTSADAANLAAGNRVFGSEIIHNEQHGVRITGSNRVTVGGATEDLGNLIYGNKQDGVRIERHPTARTPATGNVIVNNFIGTNEFADVAADTENTGFDNDPIFNNGFGYPVPLGNANGIVIVQGNANQVRGNTIMNNKNGIEVLGGNGNVIGGATETFANSISHNTGDGILITDRAPGIGAPVATNNVTVSGNAITNNGGDGIEVVGSKVAVVTIGQNVTGQTVAGLPNTIQENAGNAVVVDGGQRVSLNGNAIAGGIVVQNGANAGSAAPIALGSTIDVVRRSNSQLVIKGTITGPSTARYERYLIDVFHKDPFDPSAMRTFLGRHTVVTDENGRATFEFTINASIEVGDEICLSATSLVYQPGATSLLGDCTVHALPGPTPGSGTQGPQPPTRVPNP